MFEISGFTERYIKQAALIESEAFGESGWSETAIASELSGKYFEGLAASQNGVLAGYIFCAFAFDEAHINTFAVKACYRRCRLGACLLESMINLLSDKGCRKLTLEVRASSLPAKNLYLKYGFKELAVRKNFYKSPCEDGILMGREL